MIVFRYSMKSSIERHSFRDMFLTGVLAVFWFAGMVESTSLMRRIRERQSTDIAVNKGLDLRSQDWIRVPQPIQDVLVSIDDKLRSLDTFSYTLKLARLDFSLDQLVRRMENIETKVGRLDTKFDVRMEKIEEVVISKDIKEEFSNEHLSRRMESLNEKINNKAAYLDAKLDMKLERLLGKLELLERELHNSADDVLERLVRNEERFATIENEMSKRGSKVDELNHNVNDLRVFVKEDLKNMLTAQSRALSAQISDLETSVETTANETHGTLQVMQTMIAAKGDTVGSKSPGKFDTNSTILSNPTKNLRTSGCDEVIVTTLEQVNSLTPAFEKTLQANEDRLKKLDSDMQLYTRKVVNGIQDLWQTSDKLKMDILSSVEQGNRTREIVHQEFRLLQQQVAPISRLESKMMRINDDLDKKVSVLSSTMDNNFATLLVSQNSFIASCHRIQDEETHVYDILQQIVYEMRNRSVEENRRLNSELHQQGSRIDVSLAQILTAVLQAPNTTTTAMQEFLRQQQEDCMLRTNDVTCKVMESLCNTASVEQTQFSADPKKTSQKSEKMTSGDKFMVGIDNKSYDLLDYPLDSDYNE